MQFLKFAPPYKSALTPLLNQIPVLHVVAFLSFDCSPGSLDSKTAKLSRNERFVGVSQFIDHHFLNFRKISDPKEEISRMTP